MQEAVREAMELAQWRRFISPGARVALKVNLGWDLFLPGAVTSPWVVEGVVLTIRDFVGKIYLVESDQILVKVERALKQTRMDRLCQRYGLEWVNMSKGSFRTVPLEEGLVLKEVQVPELLLDCQIITIPVMKTHNKTIISGALKNQWGCLPMLRHNYHLILNEALADINLALRPSFAVMDATVCLEGNSPKSGQPRVADLVLASGDLVALDTVEAKVMGFDPSTILHLARCSHQGLGQNDLKNIEVVGEKLNGLNLSFKPAKHNIVSALELVLRKSEWGRMVFKNGLLLKACCIGAQGWYLLWYYLYKGRALRDEILYNTRYGQQWL